MEYAVTAAFLLSVVAGSFAAVIMGGYGITQLIVAGGETSGAVVQKLGLDLLRIGPEIDPGVPWTLASNGTQEIALALKSGNFGSEEFFVNAWSHLGS